MAWNNADLDLVLPLQVLAKAFDLKCVIPEIESVGEPILIYVDV